MSDKQITPEQALIYRIVEQWGNVINMPKMEQWLKDYAASQPAAIDIEKIPFDPNRLKQMEGHEERAEKSWEEIQKRLAEPPAVKGAVWVKASERLPKNTIHKRVFHAKYKGEPELLIYIDSKWHWYEISAQESLKYPVAPDSWSAIEWLDDESPTAAGDGKEDLAFIAAVTEEDAEAWKMEYDSCRKILEELVALKDIKDHEGKTEDYNVRQPVAWIRAKRFLEKYTHVNL